MLYSPNRARTTARAAVSFVITCLVVACHRGVQVGSSAPTAAKPTRTVATIANGRDVIAAMHDRYTGKWYHNVTFRQKTTVHLASGRDLVQHWLETAEVPGRLRIDTDVPPKGNGTLFANDSVYTFTSGKLVRADTGINELLVLGFDVYGQTPNATERILRRRGFDLTKIHESTWQGRPVYVVGAAEGDTTSRQFWIDKDRMLFVRLIERTPQGHSDIRFDQYVRTGAGWIAARVEQLVNGRRRLMEEYSEIRADVPLPDGFFDPRRWSAASHWYTP